MLILLDAAKDKKKAQVQLVQTIKSQWTKREKRIVTWRPNSQTLDVFHNGRFWFAPVVILDHQKHSKHWNAFGEYKKSGHLGITAEVNIGIEDNSQRLGGFFATDSETGSVYLLHSGKIGGGAPGVGKEEFLLWSGNHSIEVESASGKIRAGFVVAAVDSPDTGNAIARFLMQVAEFKKTVREGLLKSAEFKQARLDADKYKKEFSGRKRGKRREEFDYVTRHGEIVHELQTVRAARKLSNELVINSRLIDLYVRRGSALTEVYEVKPHADRQSMYSAIGQVMVHCGGDPKVKKFVVLPKGAALPEDIRDALKAFDIQVISFTLDPQKVIIHQ